MDAVLTPREFERSSGAHGEVVQARTRMMPLWAFSWLATLLAVTVAARTLNPTGWLGSDDAAYHSAAEQVLTGSTLERLHHHYTRLSMILPIAASLRVFGNNAWAAIVPTYLASIACVVVVAILGRVMWSWWEGLLAATVVSLLPYFRILSTTAYPDVHACLWTAVEFLLAYQALKATSAQRRKALLLIASGFALGLGISSKEFAVASAVGVFVLILQDESTIKARVRALAWYAVGAVGFALFEGVFFHFAAHDFLFPLHAMMKSQSGVPEMPQTEGIGATFLSLSFDRLSIFFVPSTSGWGWIGVAFWPVIGLAMLTRKGMRALGAWALATFVLVAFVPVSFRNGVHPYPVFHGRHILSACVPFALCAARIANRTGESFLHSSTVRKLWYVPTAAVIGVSLLPSPGLNGFRDRPTGRLCDAARLALTPATLDPRLPVFVTPSTYWRCRAILPSEVESRLRVAADTSSPNWWELTTSDILSRRAELPAPGDAYLLATPVELRGQAEVWDYQVSLPQSELNAWRKATVLARVVRGAERSVRLAAATEDTDASTIVRLMGGPTNP